MPRTERAIEVGHKNFDVTVDPYMKSLSRYVQDMVGMHMQPRLITMDAKPRTTNRMFDKCMSRRDFLVLSYCDTAGRKPVDMEMLNWWDGRLGMYRDVAGRLGVTGNDLIQLGYKPGPEFSAILEKCHQIHLPEVLKEDVIKSLPSVIKGLGLKEYVPETMREDPYER